MSDDLRDSILNAYRNGSEIGFMVECFDVSQDEIKKLLLDYKESNRYKKTFTDDFKKMIAERDINGVSRRQISMELEINANTIKKACEKFGQTMKEKASFDTAYTLVGEGLGLHKCPSCNSSRVNEVDYNTIYCISCGDEFVEISGKIFRINWEYID